MCCLNHKSLISLEDEAVNVMWPDAAHSTKCSSCDWLRVTCVTDFVDVMPCFHWLPQFSVENLKRLNQALFPPSAGAMRSLCEEGFTDAVKFLKREGWMGWASHGQAERVKPGMSLPRINKHNIFCICTHFLGDFIRSHRKQTRVTAPMFARSDDEVIQPLDLVHV